VSHSCIYMPPAATLPPHLTIVAATFDTTCESVRRAGGIAQTVVVEEVKRLGESVRVRVSVCVCVCVCVCGCALEMKIL
jgi:hypothetical protein